MSDVKAYSIYTLWPYLFKKAEEKIGKAK